MHVHNHITILLYHVTDCCTMYTRAILLHENAYEMGNTDPIHEDGDILGMK